MTRTIRILAALALLGAPLLTLAQPPAPRGEAEQPLEPRVARQDIRVPRIDARDVEVGLFAGVLQLEHLGSNPVYGIRLGYHLTEDFFLEANLGLSEASDEIYARVVRNGPLGGRSRDLEYLSVSLGFNALPGEVFLGARRAYASALFLTTGLGGLRFAGEDYFTFNLGLGFRLLVNDWLTLRIDVREHMFETDLFGESELTYNTELTAGLAVYF
ncbi:MAG: outer membrane beta-barrel domain-containing protein [Xanthomonadaceae bacterium]|nr:outer membrane beta-barrel domain-containing protein [Xanthomonadaceae bacterium]